MRRIVYASGKSTSKCRFHDSCHFYNIPHMTPHSEQMRELYCIEWPEKCEIFVAKVTHKPVPINLWPAGKLKDGNL
jgi:hypothetical protein